MKNEIGMIWPYHKEDYNVKEVPQEHNGRKEWREEKKTDLECQMRGHGNREVSGEDYIF